VEISPDFPPQTPFFWDRLQNHSESGKKELFDLSSLLLMPFAELLLWLVCDHVLTVQSFIFSIITAQTSIWASLFSG